MTDREIQTLILARKLRLRVQERRDRLLLKGLAWAVAVNLVVILPLILFACRQNTAG
jgi:hypothetical protein